MEKLQIVKKLEKLSLSEDDVVVITVENNSATWEHYNQIAKQVQYCLRDSGHGNLIMVVTSETDIKSMDEMRMNELGWFKK